MSSNYLQSLNPAQLRAVQHTPDIPLQILAGPGSGKTKVLTSRIAHLILHHHLPPSAICAVTFTNKAANEMKERLTKLIGKERTAEVRMGTFHALCAMFLRKYAKSIGVEENYTICDTEESKKLVSQLLKNYKDDLAAKDIIVKEGTVMSIISRAKAKGLSSSEFLKETRLRFTKNSGNCSQSCDIDLVTAEIYQEYEKILRKNNSLDFDDLLLFGVKLFRENHRAVKWCQHLLVDEFQDTNITQYELMRVIAFARRVTVVGDPDQSIYGWRSAEVSNLAKMNKDFFPTEQIFLEQNYRSTASILSAGMAIVAEDKSRIQKSLYASHPAGTTPVLRSFPSEVAEAAFIAGEIKRLVAHMGGILNWGDFVVLLRFNALSRTIESALQKEGIPSRILGGHKFFERMEIKDLLAYLQLVDNPQYEPAFLRAINTPARGIGEKTMKELLSRAERSSLTPLDLAEKIQDGKTPDIRPPIKRKLASFVASMRTLKKLASEGTPPADLISKLIELIGYQDHLIKTQSDWDTRWENVQELITFASDVQTDVSSIDNGVVMDPGNELSENRRDTPLRLFLQASMLSSEGDNQSEGNDKEKVTISTCHAAKGLEWPVVMVPAVEEGTFPFYRTDDIEEERRLLYVACTRAQSLLYLSHITERKVAGVTKQKTLSSFVSAVTNRNPALFTEHLTSFSRAERSVISRVLDRPEAVEDEVMRRVAEYNKTAKCRTFESDPPNITSPWQPSSSASIEQPFATAITSAKAYFPLPVEQSLAKHRAFALATTHLPPSCSQNPAATPLPDLHNHADPSHYKNAWTTSIEHSTANTEVKPLPLQRDTLNAPSQGSQNTSWASSPVQAKPSSLPTRTFVQCTLIPVQNPAAAPPPRLRSHHAGPLHHTLPCGSSIEHSTGDSEVKSIPLQHDALSSPPLRNTSSTSPPVEARPSSPPPRSAVQITLIPTHSTDVVVTPNASGPIPVAGVKRRLGMGRATTGYTNKKFKLPT